MYSISHSRWNSQIFWEKYKGGAVLVGMYFQGFSISLFFTQQVFTEVGECVRMCMCGLAGVLSLIIIPCRDSL